MRILFATALLLGISASTAARAEWEILDRGTPVYAGETLPGTAVAPTAGGDVACQSPGFAARAAGH